jgi:hypothetical protein
VGDTSAPARNFTISLEDRVRALGGPPAYIRRKRAIEDIEDALLGRVREKMEKGAGYEAIARDAQTDGTLRDLARVNELIEKHNRYYPIEANLPYSFKTGQMLERVGGKPWVPLLPWSLERLMRDVRDRV